MAYLAHMNISVFFIVPIPSKNYQVTVKVVTVSRGDTIGSLGAEKQYFVVQRVVRVISQCQLSML